MKDESDNRKAFTYVTHFDSKGIWNYKPTERIMAAHKGISRERIRCVRVYFRRNERGTKGTAALLTAEMRRESSSWFSTLGRLFTIYGGSDQNTRICR